MSMNKMQPIRQGSPIDFSHLPFRPYTSKIGKEGIIADIYFDKDAKPAGSAEFGRVFTGFFLIIREDRLAFRVSYREVNKPSWSKRDDIYWTRGSETYVIDMSGSYPKFFQTSERRDHRMKKIITTKRVTDYYRARNSWRSTYYLGDRGIEVDPYFDEFMAWFGINNEADYRDVVLPGVHKDTRVESLRFLVGYLHHTNPDDMMERCRKVFGKGKTTKPLAKALKNVLESGEDRDVNRLFVAHTLRGSLTTDQLIKILTGLDKLPFEGAWGYAKGMRALRGVMPLVSPSRRLRVIQEGLDPMTMNDIKRMLPEKDGAKNLLDETKARIFRARNLTEIHDAIVVDFNTRREYELLEAPMTRISADHYKGFDSAELDGIRITRPMTTHDMSRWGIQMGHCIGTYAQDAVSGRSQFFGVYRNGALVSNGEIMSGRVRQLYGHHNTKVLTEGEVQTVFRILYRHNLIKSVEGWDIWVAGSTRHVWDLPALPAYNGGNILF